MGVEPGVCDAARRDGEVDARAVHAPLRPAPEAPPLCRHAPPRLRVVRCAARARVRAPPRA
eukprot:790486-Pyramimonas_sp.AAC.1